MSTMKYDYEDQFVEALKTINDNGLKKKLVAIKNLVVERLSLEREYKQEHNKILYKYENLYKPFYEKRQKIVEGEAKPDIEIIKDKLEALKISEEDIQKLKENNEKTDENTKDNDKDEKGIPEFWFKCLEHFPDIYMNEEDKKILKYLKNIRSDMEENGNFKITFEFNDNDYFTNKELTRNFILDEDGDIKKIEGTKIDWNGDSKNPTIKITTKKMKNKRTGKVKPVTTKEEVLSFFSSFKDFEKTDKDKGKKKDDNKENEDDDEEKEDDEEELNIDQEFDIGTQIRDEIIPYAIEYYLDIAADDEDGDDEDEEGEGDEEEEEEEEEEDDHKKKGGYGGKRRH